MPAIKIVGIVVKKNVPEAKQLGVEAQAFLEKKKIKVVWDAPPTIERTRTASASIKEDVVKRCDMVLVLGGDGTFLSVARRMSSRSVPLLGVNMGQLGFLTEVKKAELFATLAKALKQRLPVSERVMLECRLSRDGKTLLKAVVVNDVVVSKGAIARIFDMQVMIDGALVTNIKADGLIISSPTGSTAYSLAAGGPIVAPHVPAMILAPICPHSLTLRPLVVSEESEIVLTPQYKSGSVVLTLDGQSSYDLRPGDTIKVTKFDKHPLRILHSPDRDYYSLLREKLKYGYRD